MSSINQDNPLYENELSQITVNLSDVNENASTTEEKLGAYHTFVTGVKPPSGAVLTIERTLPARLNQLVNLYWGLWLLR